MVKAKVNAVSAVSVVSCAVGAGEVEQHQPGEI